LNSNPGQFCFVFLLPLVHSENRVCLSRGVQVIGVAWRAATRTVAGVGDLVQRTEDGRTSRVLSGWAVKRSGDVVCRLWFIGCATKLMEGARRGTHVEI
jgi:hypothetical protein